MSNLLCVGLGLRQYLRRVPHELSLRLRVRACWVPIKVYFATKALIVNYGTFSAHLLTMFLSIIRSFSSSCNPQASGYKEHKRPTLKRIFMNVHVLWKQLSTLHPDCDPNHQLSTKSGVCQRLGPRDPGIYIGITRGV